MKEAIKLAIEGGYKKVRWSEKWNMPVVAMDNSGSGVAEIPPERIYLDPLFWQALQRQLQKENEDVQTEIKEWRYFADRFWDWTMKGKDADSFFTNLLEK